MPSLNVVLGEEIRRLARKEIKIQTQSLHQAAARYRADIATLKKQLNQLERRLNKLGKGQSTRAAIASEEEDGLRPRFSAGWVKKHRKKLGLSAADYGLLVGVTQLTIYNWEKGGSAPRTKQLQAWNDIRTLGKREALKRLESLG